MIESTYYIIATTFYCVVGPLAVISAYASYRNYKIQQQWAAHYYKYHKEST